MPAQREILDDRGVQQLGGGKPDRRPEARRELGGADRTADHGATLEHHDRLPRSREIGRSNQPVVATTHDRNVMAALHRQLRSRMIRCAAS